MNPLATMRYLVVLDKHRHFARAARACHITQPALSNALRALEDEFGVTVIKRSHTYGGWDDSLLFGLPELDTARTFVKMSQLPRRVGAWIFSSSSFASSRLSST
jgi:hypothetical protein